MRTRRRHLSNTDIPMIVTVQVTAGDEVILPFTNGNESGYTGDTSDWYDVYVDWGDGSPISHVTAPSRDAGGNDNPDTRHTYNTDGSYNITMTGKMRRWNHSNNDTVNNVRHYLTDVIQFGNNKFEVLGFAHCDGITTFSETDGAKFMDIGGSLTFQNCQNFESNINHWDMNNITSLNQCFKDCHNFNGNIDSWQLPRIENLQQFMNGAWRFNKPLFILDNDVSEIDVEEMMNDTRAFKQGQNIWLWDFHNIKNLYKFKASYYDRDDISPTNYENILIAADNGGLSNGILEIQSRYHAGSAGETARNSLITKGWTIHDRGTI